MGAGESESSVHEPGELVRVALERERVAAEREHIAEEREELAAERERLALRRERLTEMAQPPPIHSRGVPTAVAESTAQYDPSSTARKSPD